jgi:hypothetical protein
MTKYIKVERSDAPGSYIEEFKNILNILDGEFDNPGVQIILTVVEMSQEEYESLPEFSGW